MRLFLQLKKKSFILIFVIGLLSNGQAQNSGETTKTNYCPDISKNAFYGIDKSAFTKKHKTYVYDVASGELFKIVRAKKTKVRLDKICVKKEAIKNEANDNDYLYLVPLNLNNETLKPTNELKMRVVNINRYLYDVNVYDSTSLLNYEVPLLFGQYVFSDESDLVKAWNEKKTVIEENAGNSEKEKLEVATTIMEDLARYFELYDSMESEISKAFERGSVFLCCNEKKNDFTSQLSALKHSIEIKMGTLNDGLLEKHKKLNEYKNDLKNAEVLIKEIAKLDEKIKKDEEKEKSTEAKKEKETALNEIKKKYAPDDKSKALGILEKLIEKTNNEVDEHPKYKTLFASVASLPSDIVIRQKQQFINNMTRYRNYVETPHISLDGDVLHLRVDINERDTTQSNRPERIYGFQQDIPIIKNFAFSFNQGVFISMKGGYNLKYTWSKIPSPGNVISDNSNQYILTQSEKTPNPFGFCALGTFSLFSKRLMRIGVSGGPGLTIQQNPRLAYLGGASLTFRDRSYNEFIVTGGWYGINIDKLDNDFQQYYNSDVIYEGASPPAPQYYKEFTHGLFISMTYAYKDFNLNLRRKNRHGTESQTNGEDKNTSKEKK